MPTIPTARALRFIPALIILGLAAYLLAPQINTLRDSWFVVQNMIWWCVLLAGIAQVLSYMGSSIMLAAIVAAGSQRISLLKGVLITVASYSVGLIAGGWVGGAAATIGWVRKENHNLSQATLTGIVPALLNNAVLVGVAIFGTSYLLLAHDLSQLQLAEFCIILFALALVTMGVIASLHYPDWATRWAIWASARWSVLRRKPFDSAEAITAVNRFVHAWASLADGKWIRPLLGATANIGFDMLTLYFLFMAAGHPISLGVLFAGYGLPLILGKMAFLFPGGIGVIEGSMVALYDSLLVPHDISVVVILSYRLFSFWLPTLVGFAAASYLSSSATRPEAS